MAQPKPQINKKKPVVTTTSTEPPTIKRKSVLYVSVFSLVIVLVSIMMKEMYKYITKPHKPPNLDLEEWWGPGCNKSVHDQSIRPYQIEFTDVMIHDLKERLLHRVPLVEPIENAGFQYGVNTYFLEQILDFWQNKYNFKERERFFNKYNHFITKIQGLDIHYIHAKPRDSKRYQVLPILMLHGWPGSIREFYEIIPKLTTPRKGCKFVFEVIVPSLPGYGFSDPAIRSGLGAVEVSVVMRNLMHRIGHKKFYVQGGDWGHIIGSNMATLFPKEVLGFHTNMPLVANVKGLLMTAMGAFYPNMLVKREEKDRMYPWLPHFRWLMSETGYLHIQATKPDTIGVALNDSPPGLAAYILEKFSSWTNKNFQRAVDGQLLKKFSLTHLLDNVMVYWITHSITSSMRLYAETFNHKQFAYRMDEVPTAVPTWGIKFKYELGFQPDTILKLKYTNYLHSTLVEDGGHFAAFENPNIMADDIFDAVKTFEEFNWRLSNPYWNATTIYEFNATDIYGNVVKFEKYRGHVVIIVNVASMCNMAEENYNELNRLHDIYAESKGLHILAFPCNQFFSREPGTSREILTIVKERNYKFEFFEKVEVNGENAHPLWTFLKRSMSGNIVEDIQWNFCKFIIDKNGVPVKRFGPTDSPMGLVPVLAEYW